MLLVIIWTSVDSRFKRQRPDIGCQYVTVSSVAVRPIVGPINWVIIGSILAISAKMSVRYWVDSVRTASQKEC